MADKIMKVVAGLEFLDWGTKIFKLYNDAPEHLKQRMPGWFGLTFADEELFVAIRTSMQEDLKLWLDVFLGTLKDYEERRLRVIVTGTPATEEKEEVTEGKKKTTKVKSINKPAKDFLEDLAKLTRDYGPEIARERCLNGGVLIDNPFAKQWRETCAWFKQTFLDLAGVDSADNLIGKAKAEMPKATAFVRKVAKDDWTAWQGVFGVGPARKGFWQRFLKIIWPW